MLETHGAVFPTYICDMAQDSDVVSIDDFGLQLAML